jgi:O-antigen/teichoic acid export membrane protein
VLESALLNFVRAEQRTGLLVAYQVAKKYLGLALILGALLLVTRELAAFYAATAVVELAAVLTLAVLLFRGEGRPRPSPRRFSAPLFREMVGYGIPMMLGYELSGIVLAVGDRYIVAALAGEEPLGLYSAAYNLCQYVQLVLIASVGQAIMPLYMQLWEQKGRDETAAFVARSLRTYVMFGAPVVAGVAAVGGELLPSLASDKYASAAAILPWVIAGMVVDGTNPMLGAGVFIQRRTRRIMAVVMSGAVLNVALNLVLVPRMGVLGAAVATLASYAATALGLAAASRSLLPIAIPWGTALRAAGAALCMYLVVAPLLPGHRLLTVAVRAAAGAAIYVPLVALVDREARVLVANALGRFRWPLGR